ncbi:hypothetical protein [Glaciecola sp. 33A]|jgi:hypothetical protein|uniref:hypothetical protein n=1 Tax=Glaciecola sp. 33A TaxID=2057807 RepID=UPI000C346B34|nr:hypothetical protein [Glaciecola sp. 33A]PKI02536.1 hypothetical protein CXF81_05695 [Glaciecola sp. 33A]
MTIVKLNVSVLVFISALFMSVAYGKFIVSANFVLYMMVPTLIFSLGSLLIKPGWSIRMFTFSYAGLGLAILVTLITVYLGSQKIVHLDAIGAGIWFLVGFPIISIILCMCGTFLGAQTSSHVK